MRLWTVHPKFLDSKGLVALWREGLLAKAVLEGKTHGYLNHPQLLRFRQHEQPVDAVCEYLLAVYIESRERGYRFDVSKLPGDRVDVRRIEESRGQLDYEWKHLLRKLEVRKPDLCGQLAHHQTCPEPHPLFTVVPGEIRNWESVAFHGT
jgi:hypothetical protein